MRLCADVHTGIQQPTLTHPFLQLPGRTQLVVALVLLAFLRVLAQVERIDELVQQRELGGNQEFFR